MKIGFAVPICLLAFIAAAVAAAQEWLGVSVQWSAGITLHPQPRCHRDGQVGRSLRGPLSLFLRWLAEEESHSAGPDFVERLRQAVRGQSGILARHSGAGFGRARPARCGHPEDRRLLRRLHGRDRRRESAARTRFSRNWMPIAASSQRRTWLRWSLACRFLGRTILFGTGSTAGPRQLRAGDCRSRSRRPGTSRSRLLHQGRCQVERDSRALPAARAEDFRAARRHA